MRTKINKESKIVLFLIGIIVFVPFIFTLIYSDYIFSSNKNPDKNAEVATVYGSINARMQASVNDAVSDYDVKNCTIVNHTDGDKMQFCIVDFHGKTTGFYDQSNEELYVESYDNAILVHELFHATSLHFIKKGITDFSTHEAQETAAYDAEFLYGQIMDYKSDQISLATQKKLSAMYGK